MAYKVQTTILEEEAGTISTGDLNTGSVLSSEEATEDRYIIGISLASSMSDIVAPAAAATEEYKLVLQVGFASQKNRNGVLASLTNTTTITQQGAVTPAPASVNTARSLYVPFATPIKWAEGVTLSLIGIKTNTGTANIDCDSYCSVVYYD